MYTLGQVSTRPLDNVTVGESGPVTGQDLAWGGSSSSETLPRPNVTVGESGPVTASEAKELVKLENVKELKLCVCICMFF